MKHFLVVIDMQTDFIDGALGSAEAVAIRPAVLNRIRCFQGEILATLDTHSADYLQSAEGCHLPVAHCIKGTPGWQLDSEIAAALNERGAIMVQ